MNKEAAHRAADLAGLLLMHWVAVTKPQSYTGEVQALERDISLAFQGLSLTPPDCEPAERLGVGLGYLKAQFPEASPFIELGRLLAGLSVFKNQSSAAATLDLFYGALPVSASRIMPAEDVPRWIDHVKTLSAREVAREVHRLIDTTG